MTCKRRKRTIGGPGPAGALLALVVLPAAGFTQAALPPPAVIPAVPPPQAVRLEPRIEEVPAEGSGCLADGPVGLPINLPAALRLAQTSNLDIAQAREAVNRAQAALLRAEVAVLPNFDLGSLYNHHEGNIAKTEGNVIKVNKDSLWVRGGPSVAFQTTEAIFGPLAARQVRLATQAGLQRVNNDTLLTVADAYESVLRARRRVARVNVTLEQLLSDRPEPLRGESRGLLPLIRDFVERGAREAFPADLERVRVEVLRRQDELVAAVQELQLASAELARLLRLDPATPLVPLEDIRFPMALPGDEWQDQPLETLVATALRNRPELAENQALVEATLVRVRAARLRPLLPNVALNYNWGDFGGSPDILKAGFGPSGEIRHFAPRTEFDATVFWRLESLGLGNRAEQRDQQALHRQTLLRLLQVQDRVVSQVVRARERVLALRERVDITRSALLDANGAPAGPAFRSLRLNFERIRGGEGRPLEVMDSVRGLSDSLEAYGQAVTDYEAARFRLLIALGLPPRAWFDSQAAAAPLFPTAGVPGCPPNH
jgi:outer membrane protein TolC